MTMNKKTLLYALTAILTVGMSACKDDKSPSRPEKSDKYAIIGTWKEVNYDEEEPDFTQYLVIEMDEDGRLLLTPYGYQNNVVTDEDYNNATLATIEEKDKTTGTLTTKAFGEFYYTIITEDGRDILTLVNQNGGGMVAERVNALLGEQKNEVADDIDKDKATKLLQGFWESEESGEGLTVHLTVAPDDNIFIVLTNGYQVKEIKSGKFDLAGEGSGFKSGAFVVDDASLEYQLINSDELEFDDVRLTRKTHGTGSFALYDKDEDKPEATPFRGLAAINSSESYGSYHFWFNAEAWNTIHIQMDEELIGTKIDMTDNSDDLNKWELNYTHDEETNSLNNTNPCYDGELSAIKMFDESHYFWYIVYITDMSEKGQTYFSGWYIGQFRQRDLSTML